MNNEVITMRATQKKMMPRSVTVVLVESKCFAAASHRANRAS
jgi:hypothetical protein